MIGAAKSSKTRLRKQDVIRSCFLHRNRMIGNASDIGGNSPYYDSANRTAITVSDAVMSML